MSREKQYTVSIELSAKVPDYNLQRVIAAVALALNEEPAHDLEVQRIDVEENVEIDLSGFESDGPLIPAPKVVR